MTDKPHHPLNASGELRAFFGRRSGKRLHSRQNVLYRDVLPTLEIRLDAAFDPAQLGELAQVQFVHQALGLGEGYFGKNGHQSGESGESGESLG